MRKLLILLLLGGLFAWFIWPTRYQEHSPGAGPHASETDYPTRVDRITGDADAKRPTGEWVRIGQEEPQEASGDNASAYRPNPVTSPYTRSDQGVVNQQMNSAASTQAAVDATSQTARR